MTLQQLPVKGFRGLTPDQPTPGVVQAGSIPFFVDETSSTQVLYACIKVAGSPAWTVIATGANPNTILTTQGDLLTRGASALERVAVGTLGQQLRASGAPLTPTWVDAAKYGVLSDRSVAQSGLLAVPYYATDTYGVSICLPTGASTYAWSGFSQMVPFSVTNVAAGDNATPASSTPVQAQWAGAAAVTVGWVAPRAGSLRSLTVALSAAAAGSDCIVGVYKNGTILNAAAIVTLASATSDTKARANFALGGYTFAAGDVLDVRIRTGSGWSATTADLGVAVEIEC